MRYVFFLAVLVGISLKAQTAFDPAAYAQFQQNNAGLTADEIIQRYQPDAAYYNQRMDAFNFSEWAFLDSIKKKYDLTADEIDKLRNHHFVVTERLSYDSFGRALHDIYEKDLPVFVTTDAILYALHFSYDRILFTIERTLLEKKMQVILDAMNREFTQFSANYADQPELQTPLADVDLYITLAKSLLDSKLLKPHVADFSQAAALWDAVQYEQMAAMPIFSERLRNLDFSQFTVRGHYTDTFWGEEGERTLGNYFKAMMWLGRMDFFLTPPPVGPGEAPWSPAEIQRMAAGAMLLNNLLDFSGVRSELAEINQILTFLVGESDSLTPDEFSALAAQYDFTPSNVFDAATFRELQQRLFADPNAGQRIMSDFFITNPFAAQPDTLPVSFRLCGQRFIIDSYILTNVVYDRIFFNGHKVWRPLPDPLDAMFVMGNDNALPLLRAEMETYTYAPQLASLRYLVDAYDQPFWQQSLYNVWLQSIRELNPSHTSPAAPYFMKTAAWQQQKLNTQLASWTHLRHDNLLYAKQSYTGGTSCSYPHSYVEPYPEFYQRIASFADAAIINLLPLLGDAVDESYELLLLKGYFENLRTIMNQLTAISQKELRNEAFSKDEIEWLQKMLFVEQGSGAPPFDGWYSKLLYILAMTATGEYEGHDYLIADVHTQPTDESGAVVGHVLHVAVGKVNMGIFLAESPSSGYAPMAYIGPVLSYYEKVTDNFKRMTDEEWAELVIADDVPERPDWVNGYMTDSKGNVKPQGRELPGVVYSGVNGGQDHNPQACSLEQNYPNPFNPSTALTYHISEEGMVRLAVYDVLGRQAALLVNKRHAPGDYALTWDASSFAGGIYFARLQMENETRTIKMMLVR